MSATCIGELVRKMGERVLHKILPILQVIHLAAPACCFGFQQMSTVPHHLVTLPTCLFTFRHNVDAPLCRIVAGGHAV